MSVEYSVPPRRRPALPSGVRESVAASQGWRCALCTSLLPPAFQIDHIVPFSTCREHSESNLRALCPNCHAAHTQRQSSWLSLQRSFRNHGLHLCIQCGGMECTKCSDLSTPSFPSPERYSELKDTLGALQCLPPTSVAYAQLRRQLLGEALSASSSAPHSSSLRHIAATTDSCDHADSAGRSEALDWLHSKSTAPQELEKKTIVKTIDDELSNSMSLASAGTHIPAPLEEEEKRCSNYDMETHVKYDEEIEWMRAKNLAQFSSFIDAFKLQSHRPSSSGRGGLL